MKEQMKWYSGDVNIIDHGGTTYVYTAKYQSFTAIEVVGLDSVEEAFFQGAGRPAILVYGGTLKAEHYRGAAECYSDWDANSDEWKLKLAVEYAHSVGDCDLMGQEQLRRGDGRLRDRVRHLTARYS